MALTYLDLTNRVLRRLNEVQLTSSNFASASGFQAAAKEAVNDSINTILAGETQWQFLRALGTVTTVIGDDEYPFPADYAMIDWGSFYIDVDTPNSITASKLRKIDVEYWQQYLLEQAKNAVSAEGYGKPTAVFETKTPGIGLWHKPDKVYSIKYDYWIAHTDLVDYDDVTLIPDRHAHTIINGAMWFSYLFRDNVESAQKIETMFRNDIRDMRIRLINRTQDMRSGQLPSRNAGTQTITTG